MSIYLIEEAFGLCFADVSGTDEGASYDLLGTLECPELRMHKKTTPQEDSQEMISDAVEPSPAEAAEGETDLFDWEQDC